MRSRKSNVCSLFIVHCSLFMLLGFLGCGYTAKSILPNDIKTIFVKTFANRIDITSEVTEKDRYRVYRPNLEVDLTNAIIDRFFLDGNLRIVREDYADARLEGELIEYRRDPVRYSGKDVEEYRISLVTNVRLIDLEKNETVWEQKNIVGDTTYFTTVALQKTETAALNAALSDLARRIVERTVEGW